LEKKLEEATQEIEELTGGYKRVAADLQNFKRRAEEDHKNLVTFANSNLILEILPILDNFERAVEHRPENVSAEWLDGILQIYSQFQKILEKQGVEEIKTEGEKCDPNFHEAMLHCEGSDGVIVQELEKGYLLKGKVIRPAKVSVGNGQVKKEKN
jgi:molecular chaperone GrpE